jgi:hypothetical protein
MQHNAAQILKKTSILIKIQTEFRNNGIPVIFLKGPALSQRLFGDVAMRYSWDLDILVQAHNLGKAIELLVNSGYSGDLNSSLTKKQLAYCLINFQHFTFYNTEENSCIELHWHITSLDLLTSINTDTLFLNTEQLIIAGKPIIVLKPEYELTYLISHAAFHAFHRLQWLYDIKLYFEQPAFNKNTMNEFAANWGFTELFSLTGYLLNLYFGDINTSIPTIRKRFIKLCIYLVNRSSPELKRQYGMGDHLGRLLILDSWVKRWDLLHAVFTSPKDWKEIKLPDSLFVIYYLLRPWFVIKRLIKIKAMI